MIPPNEINQRSLSQLLEYLRTEIFRVLAERRPLEERWLRYQRMYRAVPEFQQKTFPFPGASNLVIPMIATDTDVIFSRLMGILFTPDNLWTVKARRPDRLEFAPRMQELMQWAQEAELNAYNAVGDFLLQMCKLGTGVLKQRYNRQAKLVRQFRENPDGSTFEQFVQMLVKDSPVMQAVMLDNFLIPPDATEIQEAPWVSERILLNEQQFRARQRSGLYLNHPAFASWQGTDRGSMVWQGMQEMDLFKPGITKQGEFWECWLDWDIRGIGEPIAIMATISTTRAALLRIDYNPFINQEKPYSAARFMRQEGRFYGIGLAEMLEHFQDEITAGHNQRIDSKTIANAPLYKALNTSGVRQDEPLYPGRIILLNDMGDFEPMYNQHQRFDSTIQDEQQSHSYAIARTGVNDYVSGAPSPEIGYGTAAVNMMQAANAAKRIDQTLREVRKALSECGIRCAEMYQQFNPGGKFYEVFGPEDGAILQQFLSFPVEQLRYAIGIDVTATTAALNQEAETRKNMLVQQMLQQFWMQVIQALGLVVNPGVHPIIQNATLTALHGTVTMMRRTLDTQGFQDVDQLVPKLEEILNGQQSFLAQQNTQPGGAPIGLLPPGTPGMAANPGMPVGMP